MGIGLHAVTSKEKYGDNGLFNRQREQMNRLFITEFGAVPDDEDRWEYSGKISIEVKQLEMVIKDIENNQNGIRERIKDYINVDDYIKFADELRSLMNEADKSYDEIELCWF